MKVWIDLSNSPHPLLFEPIARDLAAAGHEPLLTARDHAQTAELARERFANVELIGAPSPGGRAGNARFLARRVAALRAWARRHRPDVALSHNSYAQIVAARLARIPAVTAMDFEHQPANHLAFRLAARVLVPEALPVAVLARQGAQGSKLVRYPGFKEQIYLAERDPDPAILSRLGIERAVVGAIAVARSAPAGATYHPDENPLFEQCIEVLAARERVFTVVLARHSAQRRRLRARGLERCLVPERALDAPSLLAAADLFIGAGGTMTREAALLGVPALSLFAGSRPAVDAELERRGRLRTIAGPEAIGEVVPRDRDQAATDREALRRGGESIRACFVAAVEEVGT